MTKNQASVVEHRGNIDLPVTSDPAFEAFRRDQLDPLLDATEAGRIAALREFRVRAIKGGFVLLAAAVAAFNFLSGFALSISLVFVAILAVVVAVWAWWPTGSQANRLKANILSRMLGFYGGLKYKAHPNLDLTRYQRKGAPKFDARFARDEIFGRYRGVPVRLVEFTLLKQARVGSTTKRHEMVPFLQGHCLEITLPERCPAITVFGTRGIFTGRFEPDASLQAFPAIGTERIEVHGSDENEARKLLTANRLTALADIPDSFSNQRIMGSFYKDRLMVLIEHEPSYFHLPQEEKTDMTRHAEIIRTRLRPLLSVIDRISASSDAK